MATSEAECLDALREAAERLGESPTKAAYEELGLQPASATIIRQLGGWNAAKEAAGLETNPSTGTRVGPKPGDVELPDGRSWAELSVDQRWHYRNREHNTERTLRRRARLRRWVNERKEERGCAHCGRSDPAVLDFHHREDAGKTMDVGTMVTYGHGRDSLADEMANCDVLCANCHRREHHTPPTEALRRWVHERKQSSGGCERCDEDDPAVLDFHHVTEDKNASIARMVADGRPKADVESEMARCRVLCANCHRREHFEPPAPSSGVEGSGEHDNHK
ncbi:homing endonuclease associated repeat-containing protein [Natronomonas marina]|jgi:5-methylcytosine-specific restriction endonuclease McrA|uniref:homing endonuclease associated repeat-containing protein n=1 Tax=Natronomonas marina TaxID=2961939 RepID=UPI0020CA2029|nr:hypothetical protein [Natronomonas marina]